MNLDGVIFMTKPHLTGFELARMALALGIRAYLMKPVSIWNMALAVRKVLNA